MAIAAIRIRIVAVTAALIGVMVGDRTQDGARDGKADHDAKEDGVDQAFDLWLTRGLHQLYDTVVKEQVPDEWLRMIEADRNATDKTPSE